MVDGYLNEELGATVVAQAEEGFAAGFVDVAVDLTASGVINSQGICSLFHLFEEVVDNRGGRLFLLGCNAIVKEVLFATGFLQLVELCASEEDLPA